MMAKSRYENPFDNYDTSHRIFHMLEEDPTMILVLKNSYITDDMWKFCIQRDTSLFKEMKHPSEEMCYFAISEDGRNLKYIVSRFKYIKVTKKMALVAITSQPEAICYVPKELLTDDLKEYAYTLQPDLMSLVDTCEIRPSYLTGVIEKHPDYIKYLQDPSEDLICKALLLDPNVVVYINTFTPKIIALIQERYPELLQLTMIPGLSKSLSTELTESVDTEKIS